MTRKIMDELLMKWRLTVAQEPNVHMFQYLLFLFFSISVFFFARQMKR